MLFAASTSREVFAPGDRVKHMNFGEGEILSVKSMGADTLYEVMFDTVGVLPQLLTLDCGVTLATYGRLGLFLRATGDASGVSWEQPIELELSEGPEFRSCYYTHMIPLDKNTALLAYSDFHHPQPNGQGEGKAIMVRTIKAVMD